jgi:hypothetical protein
MVVTYFIERSLSKRIRLLQQSNLDCTCLYDQRQADVCLESAVLLQLVQIFAAPEIRQPKMGFFQLLIACLVLALAPTWSYVISKSNNLFLNTITYVIESFSILRIWRTTGSTGTEHHHGCLRAIHTVRKKIVSQQCLISHLWFCISISDLIRRDLKFSSSITWNYFKSPTLIRHCRQRSLPMAGTVVRCRRIPLEMVNHFLRDQNQKSN